MIKLHEEPVFEPGILPGLGSYSESTSCRMAPNDYPHFQVIPPTMHHFHILLMQLFLLVRLHVFKLLWTNITRASGDQQSLFDCSGPCRYADPMPALSVFLA